jgi:hypothetical protein
MVLDKWNEFNSIIVNGWSLPTEIKIINKTKHLKNDGWSVYSSENKYKFEIEK